MPEASISVMFQCASVRPRVVDAQAPAPYLDPSQPIETRITDLDLADDAAPRRPRS